MRALRALRPGVPLVGVVPHTWDSRYYPSTRSHRGAVTAARRWAAGLDVVMLDWETVVGPYVPSGLNPDGLHWGWSVHRAVADDAGRVLVSLLHSSESATG